MTMTEICMLVLTLIAGGFGFLNHLNLKKRKQAEAQVREEKLNAKDKEIEEKISRASTDELVDLGNEYLKRIRASHKDSKR